ncbi:MAG: glycoside hydrolase family 76 protein [Phormidesmis sp. CAN_BIN44]|nr:glycoside hydrolase family 76 protein [Phormidesmis sp. CAN_BIN44]
MVLPGSEHGMAAGMAALQLFYNLSTGLWNSTNWWNSANVLETTIDYSAATNTSTYRSNIHNTFEKNKNSQFLNPWFYDDQGWWALTWIKAYDLTGEARYLTMAKTIFNDMKQGWDSTCGGGVWWDKKREYKNAITNELFLTIAARLHLRTPGDKGTGSYLDWAKREWKWFKQTKMINQKNLVNDGLNSACKNNGQTTWTYNQGVILGGLVDLYKSTNDRELLTQAHAIAEAAITHLAPNGVLQEPCDPATCGTDAPQFKGIFMKNLAYLYQTSPRPKYKQFIAENARSIWWQSRNHLNQFGFSWAEEFDIADASRQSAALDTLNAAFLLNNQRRADNGDREQSTDTTDRLVADRNLQPQTFKMKSNEFNHDDLILRNVFKDD